MDGEREIMMRPSEAYVCCDERENEKCMPGRSDFRSGEWGGDSWHFGRTTYIMSKYGEPPSMR
jgi:hypothetical protein